MASRLFSSLQRFHSTIVNDFKNFNILWFDFETTGLSHKTDHIIQACFMNHRNGEHFVRYILPPDDVKISKEASEVNGLTLEKLKSDECRAVKPNKFILDFANWYNGQFEDYEYKPIYWIAHNCWGFDMLMWEAFIHNHGLNHFQNTYYADTMLLFRDLLPNLGSYSLFNVHYHLYGKDIKNAHDSLGDVLAMRKITQDLLEESQAQQSTLRRTVYHTTTVSSVTRLSQIENFKERLINYSIPANSDNYRFSQLKKPGDFDYLNQNIVRFPIWEFLEIKEKGQLFEFFNKNNIMYVRNLVMIFLTGEPNPSKEEILRYNFSKKDMKMIEEKSRAFRLYMKTIIDNKRVIGITSDYLTNLCMYTV